MRVLVLAVGALFFAALCVVCTWLTVNVGAGYEDGATFAGIATFALLLAAAANAR